MNRLTHLSSLVERIGDDDATQSEFVENAEDLAEALTPLLPLLVGWERTFDASTSEYHPTCESAPYGSGCPGTCSEDVAFWRAAQGVAAFLRSPTDAPPVMAVAEPGDADVERVAEAFAERAGGAVGHPWPWDAVDGLASRDAWRAVARLALKAGLRVELIGGGT